MFRQMLKKNKYKDFIESRAGLIRPARLFNIPKYAIEDASGKFFALRMTVFAYQRPDTRKPQTTDDNQYSKKGIINRQF